MPAAQLAASHDLRIGEDGSQTRDELDVEAETKPSVEPAAVLLFGHRRHLRGRRGGLKDLPNMPLDVVFEVLSHLTPRDLLALARSTKDFRRLLMSRHSAPIWRQSRKQLHGLPEPPSPLCEPAYANLLFSPQCHRCLKVNINTVIWPFYARYCNPCKRIMFATDNREVEAVIKELLGKAYHVESSLSYVRRHQGKCHKDEIETIKNRLGLLRTEEEKEKFREERKAFVTESDTYGALLPTWKHSYNDQKYHEKFALRTARGNAIKDKLREEGWGDVVDHFNFSDGWNFSTLKEVNRTTKLTESGWTRIRQSVLNFVTPIRPRYFRARLTKVYEARVSAVRMLENKFEKMCATRFSYLQEVLDAYQLAEGLRTAESDLKPGFADFACMPLFKNLIQDETEDVTQEQFHALQPLIPDLIRAWTDRWQAAFTQKALDGMATVVPYTPSETSPLDLAIVSFVCTVCKQPQLRWPHVLAHRCFRKKPERLFGPAVKKQHGVYGTAILQHARYDHDAPFRGGQYTVFNQAVARTRAVIIACGLDPNAATYEDLEGCGARLKCSLCAQSNVLFPNTRGLSWQAAIQHSIGFHADIYAAAPDCWDRVPDNDAAMVVDFELHDLPLHPLAPMSPSGISDRILGCTQCNYHGSYTEIHEHVLISHWVYKLPEDLVLDEDFYVHVDSKQSCGPLSPVMQLLRDTVIL